jgi:hypothetical protein
MDNANGLGLLIETLNGIEGSLPSKVSQNILQCIYQSGCMNMISKVVGIEQKAGAKATHRQ